MKLTYIYHSGFALETNNCVIIIDFFKDSVSMHKGIVYDDLLKSTKNIYVLSTHSHADHFNKEVLRWKESVPDIKYIFSKEILDSDNKDIVFLDKLEEYSDNQIRVKAFGSTDLGGSFLIECEGKKIFHAGDLNNWHWDEESTSQEVNNAESAYLNELNILYIETAYLDLAMFPVDFRLGKNYMKGAQQFVDKIKVGLFAPMHFGKDYEKANDFGKYAENAGCKFFYITEKGDSIAF